MPPSIIDQIREQQAWEQPKKRGSVGFIAGTIAAFAGGISLVMSWGAFPSLSPKALFAPKQQAVVSHNKPAASVDFHPSGGRLGDASESKLLRTCMPSSMGAATAWAGMDNKALYNLLSATNQMMSIAAWRPARRTRPPAPKPSRSMWAEVADCVFRQNGYVLCEPDNRALAVEAVTAFVKQSAFAAAPEQDSDSTRRCSPRSNAGARTDDVQGPRHARTCALDAQDPRAGRPPDLVRFRFLRARRNLADHEGHEAHQRRLRDPLVNRGRQPRPAHTLPVSSFYA